MVGDDGGRVKVRPGDDIEEVTGLEFSGEEAAGLIPRIATWQAPDDAPERDSSGQFVSVEDDGDVDPDEPEPTDGD